MLDLSIYFSSCDNVHDYFDSFLIKKKTILLCEELIRYIFIVPVI